MTFIIPEAELQAAHERYIRAQVAKAAPAPGYTYKSRTQAQWERRIDQNFRSNRSFRPRLEPVMPVAVEPDPEIEAGDEDDGEFPRSKVGPNTLCLCGHKRSDHHVTPEPHVADGEHNYYCITSHCSVFTFKDGKHKPCTCPHFRANETDAMKFTRPRVGDYDRCANPACGHWKIDHCIKSKPGKVLRLKPGELAYRIVSKPDGTGSYPCKHFSFDDPACQCSSTSCAHTENGESFCTCSKFENPLLVRKTKPTGEKKRNRKAVAASLEGGLTCSTPENVVADSPAKPRRSKKQKIAFVTGTQALFPSLEVNP
jgi:hypothetical protein